LNKNQLEMVRIAGEFQGRSLTFDNKHTVVFLYLDLRSFGESILSFQKYDHFYSESETAWSPSKW
jgi:hypothetical protein